MPGLADNCAQAFLNDMVGIGPAPTAGGRYLALFTAAPLNDQGTGGTEVTGGAYARTRIGGQVGATASWALGALTISITAPPAWLVALGSPLTPAYGANVYDSSGGVGGQVGTVQSIIGTTLTLQAPALRASTGSTDGLVFSAWPLASAAAGAEPTTTPASVVNGSQINFPQATANWGTAVAWAIMDAPTAGNMRFWDYLGNYPWLPATCVGASPAVITAPRHGLATGAAFAVTAKAGGALPTFTQSSFTNNLGTLLTASATTDTFTAVNAGTAVNTSTTGDFMIRGVTPQAIPLGITAQFPAGSFPLYAA